jgi:hypothetical protein
MANKFPDWAPSIDSSMPLNMDKYARNARLYPMLLKLGLFVEAHYTDDDRTKIEHFVVCAGIPDN